MTISPSSTTAQRYQRNATLVVNFLLVTLVVSVVTTAISAFQTQSPQSYMSLGLTIGLMLTAVIALVLIRLGRVNLGVGIMLVANMASVPIYTLFTAGLGVLLSVVVILVTTTIASQTLPRRLASRFIIASIASGLVTLLLDLFGPSTRLRSASPLQAILISGGLLLVYSILVARQFRNYSLRTKLIVAFVGLLLVSISAITLFTGSAIRSSLTEETGNKLHNIAVSGGNSVGTVLANEIKVILALSLSQGVEQRLQIANALYEGDDPAEVQAALEELDRRWRASVEANNTDDALVWSKLNDRTTLELGRFQASFPEHVEIFYTDRFGGLVAALQPTSDFYQADEEWWQAAYNNGEGGLYIGQPEYDESSATFGVQMAVPLRLLRQSVEQELAGILRTTFSLESLQKLLVASPGEGAAIVELLFPDGQIMSSKQAGEKALDAAVLEQLSSNTATHFNTNLDGEAVVVSTSPVTSDDPLVGDLINQLNWVALVHQREETAFAPIESITRTTLLVSIAALVVSALLASLLAQYLSRPILQLTEVAAKVSAGDLAARAPVNSEDEIGVLARTFNNTTAQLGELIGSLESRVADRTRALAISADISRRLSGILDQKQLIAEVVEQIRSTFNYYHVHIYLYDAKREHLTLAGGTGEAARTMLARGHRLEEGRGLVGRAAGTNSPVLVPDTSKDPGWLPNPLLPDTKAEVAVPITTSTRVLGVLDVQQNRVNGLGQDDVQLLQAIANQVAIGLQNTRSYEQIQNQAEREAMLNAINQKIQNATRIEDVVQIAAHELGQALGAQRAVAQVSTAKITETRRV